MILSRTIFSLSLVSNLSVMQGINKAKHVHLVDALLQLERLMDQGSLLGQDLKKAEDLRLRLAEMYQGYEQLLDDLALHIAEYKDLFNEVKIQYLGKKLKELKKQERLERSGFVELMDHARLAYGT